MKPSATGSSPRDRAPSLAAIQQLAAHIFPLARPILVEYVPEGISTYVYRLTRGDERFYLRALPETGDGFAPEVHAHTLLREQGVRIPEIVHFEHHNERLGLSVMVTREIAGRSVASQELGEQTQAILFAAGRDLALINSLPVDGFSWIARDQPVVSELAAELSTSRAFLTEHLDNDLALLRSHAVEAAEVATIERIIARHDAWLDAEQATLGHGDFDTTHIFAHEGVYSGIIDFGEIRGTDRWYDLGHFRLHDGELVPARLLPALLEGYRSVAPLPEDAERRIAFASLLIGIRTLGRLLVKRPSSPLVAHCLGAIRRDVAFLAAGTP